MCLARLPVLGISLLLLATHCPHIANISQRLLASFNPLISVLQAHSPAHSIHSERVVRRSRGVTGRGRQQDVPCEGSVLPPQGLVPCKHVCREHRPACTPQRPPQIDGWLRMRFVVCFARAMLRELQTGNWDGIVLCNQQADLVATAGCRCVCMHAVCSPSS